MNAALWTVAGMFVALALGLKDFGLVVRQDGKPV
jgi:hypothetical protein